MLRISFLKPASLTVLSMAALLFASAPFVGAQTADAVATVKTVPAAGAPTLIAGPVNEHHYVFVQGGIQALLPSNLARPSEIGSNAIPRNATDLGKAPADMTMGLQLVLRRSQEQEQALMLLVNQSQNPRESTYGKTITPLEMAQSFGLAGSDLSALEGWLTSKGFNLGNVDNGRLSIDFRGTVTQVDDAFRADIHLYKAADGSQHYANAAQVKVPEALAPAIVTVSGLQNFKEFRAKGFDSPVTDFMRGPAAESDVIEASPETVPVPRLDGEMLHDYSFTASSASLRFGTSATLNVRLGGGSSPVEGALSITDEAGKYIAFIADVTACTPYNNGYGRSCTMTYKAASPGTHTLSALYTGDKSAHAVSQTIIENVTGTNPTFTTVIPNPVEWNGSSTYTLAYEVAVAWYAGGTTPTGAVAVYADGQTAYSIGSITLPSAAGGISSGSGTDEQGDSYSYSCSASGFAYSFTCTLSDTGAVLVEYNSEGQTLGAIPFTASYGGDGNYASSTQTAENQDPSYVYNTSYTPTIAATVTGGLTAGAYGAAKAETINSIVETGTDTANTANPGVPTGLAFLQLTGPVSTVGNLIGTLATYAGTAAGCTNASGATCTFTSAAFSVPADLIPGTYALTLTYSGNENASGSRAATITPYLSATTATNLGFTVGKGTVQFGTMTFNPTQVAQGVSQTLTITDPLTYPGVPPTGAVTFVVTNSGGTTVYTSGSATCTGTAYGTTTAISPTSCSVVVPAATVAGLAAGNYTVTATFTTDTYYGAATGTGTFSVKTGTTAAMTTSAYVTPAPVTTQAYGSLAAFTVYGTLSWTGSGTAPTKADVTFTSTAAGTFGTVTCANTTSPYDCSATFTPTAADAVGSYNINLNFSGDTNYASSVSTTTGNFVITKATFTTITVSSTVTTEAFGATTAVPVSVTLATAGAVAPTAADFTWSASTAGIGTFGTTTCGTPSAGSVTCSVTFTPNGTAAVGSYNLNVAFSGDTNYNSFPVTTTAYGQYKVTAATPTLTIAPSPITASVGSTTAITLTVTSNTPGTVNFTGGYATYGALSATSCTITATTCTVTFTPNGTTAGGTYSNILTATLTPTSTNYVSTSVNDSLVIAIGGNLVIIPATPAQTDFFDSASQAFTTTLAWTQPGVQPTGTITLTDTTSGLVFGGVTLPPTATATSGNCSTQPSGSGCTFTCTPNLTDLLVSCTLTDTTATANTVLGAGNFLQNVISASYVSTNSFASASALTDVYYNESGGTAPTITTSAATLTASTYGLTQTESATVTVKSNGTNDPYPFQSASGAFLQATSTNQIGTLYTTTDSACGSTTTSCVISGGTAGATPPLLTIPAVVTPGSYTVTYYYTGNYVYSTGYDAVGSLTAALTVNKQTPSFGTITFSPAATEPYGTSQAITVSAPLKYMGVGEKPTGAVTFAITNSGGTAIAGSPFTATCVAAASTGSGNAQNDSLTCSATIPAATIAAGAAGTYTATASYATDTNYATCSGTGTFTITKQTTTTAIVTPAPAGVTQTYGSETTFDATATLTWAGSGNPPTAADVVFTTNATGSFGTTTCGTTSPATCTSTFTPTSSTSTPVGSYYVSVSFTGDTNYSASATSQTAGAYVVTGEATSIALTVTGGSSAGTTSAGVTTVSLTATVAPAISGVTVNLVDTTDGISTILSGTTNSSGVVTFTVTTSTTGVSAGLNNLTATAVAGSNTTGSTSTALPIYLQGILQATSLNHNFTVYTASSTGVDGTTDGSPICNGSNGVNGQTCITGYSVAVTNFTSTSRVITAALGSNSNNAFSYATNCPAAGLASGAKCQFVFYYLPPYGDGCTPGSNCETGGTAPNTYQEGTFEETSWSVGTSGVLKGLYFSGTTGGGTPLTPVYLEGKAVLATGNYLMVSPASGTLAFGPQAPNYVPQAQNIVVTNTSSGSVSGIAYGINGGNLASGSSTTSNFTVNNQCSTTLAAGASCQISVSYSAASAGTSSTTLTITPPSPETGVTSLTLSGQTVATTNTLSLTTTTHNFGNVTNNTTVTFGLGITNNSTTTPATLSFQSATANGFTFNTSGCTSPMPVSSSCQIQVSFTPTAVQSYSQNLGITSNLEILPNGTTTGPNYTDTVTFTGAGVAGGNLTATSTGHDFGNTSVGSQATSYGVELTNNTGVALTLSLGPLSNTTQGYTSATNCPATLAINSNCEVVFYYTPNAVGLTQVTYPVTATNGGSTYQMNGSVAAITLSGTGQ